MFAKSKKKGGDGMEEIDPGLLCNYLTRSMLKTDKQRMKKLGNETGKTLEQVMNRVIEIGLPQLEVIVGNGGW